MQSIPLRLVINLNGGKVSLQWKNMIDAILTKGWNLISSIWGKLILCAEDTTFKKTNKKPPNEQNKKSLPKMQEWKQVTSQKLILLVTKVKWYRTSFTSEYEK